MTLIVQGLQFEQGNKSLFSEIQFELNQGDFLQISGINGSGKTTLLRILANLIQPTKGRLLWNNHDAQNNHSYKNDLYYLGHQLSLKPNLTVSENISLLRALQGNKDSDTTEILKQLKLVSYRDTLVSLLSAGQKKRVALAVLVSSNKKIWLLDEPYAALDQQGQDVLNQYIERHRERGGIVVMTSPSCELTNQSVILNEVKDLSNVNQILRCAQDDRADGHGDRTDIHDDRTDDNRTCAHNEFYYLTRFPFFTLLYTEFLQNYRQAFSWLTPLLFFIFVNCLLPISLGTQPELLKQIAPGMIWITVLLSVLLALAGFFHEDEIQGGLDAIVLSMHPLFLLVCTKIFCFWILYCFPLILVTPLLGYTLNLNRHEEILLCISLLLGTPVLCCIGSIGSALVMKARNSFLLLPILILPLCIPILIFGSQVVYSYSPKGCFAIMGALLLISISLAPLLTSIALKIGVNR